eukprot:344807-Hanusia_phi.AAC.7
MKPDALVGTKKLAKWNAVASAGLGVTYKLLIPDSVMYLLPNPKLCTPPSKFKNATPGLQRSAVASCSILVSLTSAGAAPPLLSSLSLEPHPNVPRPLRPLRPSKSTRWNLRR